VSTSSLPRPSRRRRKRLAPHKIVGSIVVYGFALDGAVRFLNWLIHSLMHDIGP
jgi:hypothetical protein